MLALLHAGTGISFIFHNLMRMHDLKNYCLGKIEWRHLLGNGPKSKISSLFVLNNGKVASISSSPTTVRVFDMSSGILQWEATVAKESQPIVSKWAASTRDIVLVEINPSKSGYELLLTEYSSNSGTENVSPTIELPWFTPGTDCQLVFPHLVCLHPHDDAVNVVDVRNSDSHQRIQFSDLGVAVGAGQSAVFSSVSRNLVTLRTTDTLSVYKVTDEGLQRIGAEWPSETVLVSVPSVKDAEAQQRYMSGLVKQEKDYLIRIYDLEADRMLEDVSGTVKLPEEVGEANLLSTFLMRKANGDLSYRYAIGTTDDSFHYGMNHITCKNAAFI